MLLKSRNLKTVRRNYYSMNVPNKPLAWRSSAGVCEKTAGTASAATHNVNAAIILNIFLLGGQRNLKSELEFSKKCTKYNALDTRIDWIYLDCRLSSRTVYIIYPGSRASQPVCLFLYCFFLFFFFFKHTLFWTFQVGVRVYSQ